MSRKARKTTSVSTLVSDSDNLVIHAHSNKLAPEVMKEMVKLHNEIATLNEAYTKLRETADLWLVKFGMVAEKTPDVNTILALIAAKAESETVKK